MDEHILIASQEKSCRDLCVEVARRLGFAVSPAESAPNALDILNAGGIDMILVDAQMPGLSVVEQLKSARSNSPGTDVVVVTNSAEVGLVHEVAKQYACEYIVRPFGAVDLERLLDRVIKSFIFNRTSQSRFPELHVVRSTTLVSMGYRGF